MTQKADVETAVPDASNLHEPDTGPASDTMQTSDDPRKAQDHPVASTAATDAQTSDPAGRNTLHFSADKGSSRSTIVAGLLVLGIVGWMGSGFLLPSETEAPVLQREEPRPVAVAVATSTA